MTVWHCKCPSLQQCSKGPSANALVGGTGVMHGRLHHQVEQLYLKTERLQLWRRMRCSHFTNSGLMMWGLKEKTGSKKRLFFSGRKCGRRTQNGGERETDRKWRQDKPSCRQLQRWPSFFSESIKALKQGF